MSNLNIKNKFINSLWTNNIPTNSNLINYDLKIISTTTPNLNSYLVSKVKSPVKEGYYMKCNNHLCKICKYAITDRNIFNFKSLEITLPTNSNCTSINIIYAIHCLKCSKSYIGQSSRSSLTRISEHIKKIIKYKKTNTENINIDGDLNSVYLYNHFKKNDHNFKEHFRFQILYKDIINYRIRLETDFIYIFNTMYPEGLNSNTPDHNNIFETYFFNY